MYRREYPDVPGLFDARFSEYNQPSLVREFQKTWLVSLIGLTMLATGSGILFWNEGRAVRTAAALEGLNYLAILIVNIPVLLSRGTQGHIGARDNKCGF